MKLASSSKPTYRSASPCEAPAPRLADNQTTTLHVAVQSTRFHVSLFLSRGTIDPAL
jgi:hypothetical protein